MNLPMRITFKNSDYTYKVISKNIVGGNLEVKISLQGKEHTLFRTIHEEWNCPEEAEDYNHDLLKAIGKNIALRYRL